jgi:hypothetical protein
MPTQEDIYSDLIRIILEKSQLHTMGRTLGIAYDFSRAFVARDCVLCAAAVAQAEAEAGYLVYALTTYMHQMAPSSARIP